MRRTWLTLHRWLGFICGLWISVIALTGSLNVYFFEIDEWLNPELQISPTSDGPRPLAQIARALTERFPDAKGRWRFEMPTHERGTIKAWYSGPDEGTQDGPGAPNTAGRLASPLVSIDPYRAEIVSVRDFYNGTLVGFIYDLHMTLLLPVETGQTLAGVLAIALMISLMSGLYLWWPRNGNWKMAFIPKRKASLPRRVLDLHRLTGVFSSLVLMAVAASGLYFVFNDWIEPAIASILDVRRDRADDLTSAPSTGARPISLDEAVAIADRTFPGAQLRIVQWPLHGDGVIAVSKRQGAEVNVTFPVSRVLIDRYSGRVLDVRDSQHQGWGNAMISLAYPVHNGEIFGAAGRFAVFIAGFAPMILFISGAVRWLGNTNRARSVTKPN